MHNLKITYSQENGYWPKLDRLRDVFLGIFVCVKSCHNTRIPLSQIKISMTLEEIKYWACRMQMAAIGNKNARKQISVMEKMLAYANQPSLRSEVEKAAKEGLLKDLLANGFREL